MNIRIKLTLLCCGLVIIPTLMIGSINLLSLHSFGKKSTHEAYNALEDQAEKLLQSNLRQDLNTFQKLIEQVQNGLIRLSLSKNTINFIIGMNDGEQNSINPDLDQLMDASLKDIIQICQEKHKHILNQLKANLTISNFALSSRGGISEEGLSVEWNAKNQMTSEEKKVVLSLLQVGFDPIQYNDSFEKSSPVVDKVSELIGGGICALFQKMNEQDDMLCIASTQKKTDGKREISYYLPAVLPDGAMNPIQSTLKGGKEYYGRVRLGYDWFWGAVTVLKSDENNPIGMLFVGLKEKDLTDLHMSILSNTIGQHGLTFVVDSQGELIIHPQSELIGQNIVNDLHIDSFKTIFVNPVDQNQFTPIDFEWNAQKMKAKLALLTDLNWIPVVAANQHDFSKNKLVQDQVKEEIRQIYETSTVDIENKDIPIYRNIRLFLPDGKSVLTFNSGNWDDKPSSLSSNDFSNFLNNKSSEPVWNAGIIIDENQTLLRIASPIIFNNHLLGFVNIDVLWDLLVKPIQANAVKQALNTFIVDMSGAFVLSPSSEKQQFKTLQAYNNPQLTEHFEKKIKQGMKGDMTLNLNGIDYYVIYEPLKLWQKNYGILMGIPSDKFLSLANTIKTNSQKSLQTIWVTILVLGIFLVILGLVLGFWLSNVFVQPITKVVTVLKNAAEGHGDLTFRLQHSSRDEVGALVKWFNLFMEMLQSLIKSIVQDVNRLNNSSQQLNSISLELATNATQLSQESTKVAECSEKTVVHINQIASSAEEVSSQIASISASSEQKNQHMKEIQSETQNVSGAVNTAASAIEEMYTSLNEVSQNTAHATQVSHNANQVTQNSVVVVEKLMDAAKEIGKVTQLIKEIASQTNLLSLNAFIEAANAGDSGKGFGVVANEVKALAQQTGKEVTTIQDKIHFIQNCTDAVEKEMKSIVTITTQIDSVTSTIAAAVEEQTSTVNEISNNMSQTAQVYQSVASSIENMLTLDTSLSKSIEDVYTAANTIAADSGDAFHEMETVSQSIRDVAGFSKRVLEHSTRIQHNADDLSKLSDRIHQLVSQFRLNESP
ncbi:MAG: Cache 3/Cache 2 fusion domain-containing protein [Desulfobacterales bacterium]|nr:Cache 3/Cache 2 fusion domain-containing protein [Desulfobacterales bacterium]